MYIQNIQNIQVWLHINHKQWQWQQNIVNFTNQNKIIVYCHIVIISTLANFAKYSYWQNSHYTNQTCKMYNFIKNAMQLDICIFKVILRDKFSQYCTTLNTPLLREARSIYGGTLPWIFKVSKPGVQAERILSLCKRLAHSLFWESSTIQCS